MKPLVVDTETTGLFCEDGARLVTLQVWSGKGEPKIFYVDRLKKGEDERLLDKLESRDLIFHNAPFDLHMLESGWDNGRDLSASLLWDTKPTTRVLDGKRHPDTSLKPISERLWGRGVTQPDRDMDAWLKANRKKRSQMVEAPPGVFEPYALADCLLTWRLYRYHLALLEQSDEPGRAAELCARELALCLTLFKMEHRGIAWDAAGAQKVSAKLSKEIERIKAALPFRPTKPGAADYYFNELDFVPTAILKSGLGSMDKIARAALIQQEAPYAEEFDRLERYKQYVSMWYEGWTRLVSPDGRLRPHFRQTGTVSMRLSVERIQLQAIPHDYRLDLPKGLPTPRALLRAGKGKSLWELDVSQAEVRIASAIAKCSRMLEVIAEGKDVHDETTKDIFAVNKEDKTWKRYRQVAKRLNFAMVYGVGVRALVEQVWIHAGLRITEAEARKYLNLHRKVYPEFVRAASVAERRAQSRGFVKLASGMKRWFYPGEELHKAFNQVIQGGVAEAMKDVMLLVEDKWPGVMLLQIHDSIVVEVEEEAIVEEIRNEMAGVFESYFPTRFVVDVKEWGS